MSAVEITQIIHSRAESKILGGRSCTPTVIVGRGSSRADLRKRRAGRSDLARLPVPGAG